MCWPPSGQTERLVHSAQGTVRYFVGFTFCLLAKGRGTVPNLATPAMMAQPIFLTHKYTQGMQ